ncbi:MAG: hypothetical protein QOH93_2008 [Chloroflexia bacterium]|jgi:uncharacterized membrane protein required for colicin V production|nr:hypothetical protein [Chloroflexia bacterium]
MISGSPSEILAMALPVVLAIVLGILGAVRGFRREAIVSGSIVLGALIVQQWASLWSDDLYGMYTGMSREMLQVVLSGLLLSLIVLVLGYGLGSLVRRGPVTGGSRAGGLLLGLANGSAIGAWILRYIYTSLDGAQPSSILYQNSVTQSFMIWAGWFPVALAVLGAIVALVAPFRRSEVEVTQAVAAAPATAPVWTPPPPAPAYTATNTTTTTAAYGAPPYGAPQQPSRMSGPVGAATPYDRTVANLSPYATPEVRPQGPYDAPATRTFGGMDVPPPAPAQNQYNPGAYSAGQYDTSTRNFPPAPRDVGAAPSTDVLSGGYQGGAYNRAPVYRSAFGEKADTGDTGDAAAASAEGTEHVAEAEDSAPESTQESRPTPDWLAASTVAAQPESLAAPEPDEVEARDAVEAADRQEEATHEPPSLEAEPSGTTPALDAVEAVTEPGEEPVAATETTNVPAEVICTNCGATVLNNAKFCTECGTPVLRA